MAWRHLSSQSSPLVIRRMSEIDRVFHEIVGRDEKARRTASALVLAGGAYQKKHNNLKKIKISQARSNLAPAAHSIPRA